MERIGAAADQERKQACLYNLNQIHFYAAIPAERSDWSTGHSSQTNHNKEQPHTV